MEPVVFKSSVDRRNRIVSALVGAPVIVIACLIGLLAPENTGVWPALIVLPAIMAVTAAVVYGNLPRRIVVTPAAIALKCPFRTKIIPRDAATDVRRVQDFDTQGLWRKCGSDGVFGKWGLFASKRYPRMHFYAKRGKRDWILVESGGKIYVLAPDDGDGFVKLFR